MIGRIIGWCRIVDKPTETIFHHGKIEDIAGKELPVLERNDLGDCLCLYKDVGLVDVEHTDVAEFRPAPVSTVEDILRKFMAGMDR